MTREDLIRQDFDRTMRLIELGPSHSPIVAKANGWQTTVIDHASQADLVEKYRSAGVNTDRIEPVDFVWQDGPLTALIPQEMHGRFDGLIASHVGEHVPDLIAFFKDASALIKPDGLMALALPDKRVCFDFFQPLTMTGDVVDAHLQGQTRHRRRTFFNQAAYFTKRDGEGGWPHSGSKAPFHLVNSIFYAQRAYDSSSEDPVLPYADTHAWAFTPKSFELLMLELNLLGHIDWSVRTIQPTASVEFLVWLERKPLRMPEEEINSARLSLLTAVVYEGRDAIAQLDAAEPVRIPEKEPLGSTIGAIESWPQPRPSIAVIIPLFNGARYIEEALRSVFLQSVPANEIIVVDDGSTDDGAGVAIVEGLAKIHPIKLLHKPNGGQSSARNYGVRESSSELIAFLDQDDVWYEEHLQELAKPFQGWSARPLGWVYSNLDEINEGGSLVSRSLLSTLPTVHPKRHVRDCIRQDMFVLPSAALISRAAFNAVGGFDEQLIGYEDDDLFLRIFSAGYDNIYLDTPLSKWRIHLGSSSYSIRMVRSRAIYMRKLLERFPDDPKRLRYWTRDVILPRFLDHALQVYETAINVGDREGMDTAWAEALSLARRDKDMVPRMFHHTLVRYKSALVTGDDATISAAWSDLAEVAGHIQQKSLRLRATLNLLRNPTVSKTAFAVRRIARPAMRWALSA
jgi:glycosyltransferase involved in cell wall biosynthesis